VVTLPKVTAVVQVEAMVTACERLEAAHGLTAGTLRFEIQVETPQSILGADGTVAVARMIHAASGRCTGLHYGTYDYTASCGIGAVDRDEIDSLVGVDERRLAGLARRRATD
jgi:citrate lyase beta subunit